MQCGIVVVQALCRFKTCQGGIGILVAQRITAEIRPAKIARRQLHCHGETIQSLAVQAARKSARGDEKIGVDIVLFDGEDYGRENDEGMFLLGSRYYAVTFDGEPPVFGILLDLVGDREARFPQEAFSRQYAGDVLDMVWDAAATLGLSRFTRDTHSPVLDDHVPS